MTHEPETRPGMPRRLMGAAAGYLDRAGLRKPVRNGVWVAVLALAVSVFIPNYYKSEASILPSSNDGPAIAGLTTAAAALTGMSLGGSQSPDASYTDIVQSRWMAEKLLNAEYDYRLPKFLYGPKQACHTTLLEYLDKANYDQAVMALSKMLNVNQDLKTNLVTLDVETRSPELSQQVARLAVSQLQDFVVHQTTTRGGEKAKFTRKRLAEAEQETLDAERKLRDFAYANRGYSSSTDPGVRLEGQRLEADLGLRRELMATISTNLEQALVEEQDDTPVLNILDPGNLPQEKSWPRRGLMALILMFLAGLITVVVEHKATLAGLLSGSGIRDKDPE